MIGTAGVGWKSWSAAFALIFVGAAAALFLYVGADRRSVGERAAKDILFDATLAATSLDAILRVASHETARLGDSRAGMKESLDLIAFDLPEAANIYLLDEKGSVLRTAHRRLNPTLAMEASLFERMRAGAILDCRIVEAPEEGGKVLAFIRRIDNTEDDGYLYAAALFTGYTLQSGVSTLLSRAYGSIDVTDSVGATLVLVQATESAERTSDQTRRNETRRNGDLNALVLLSSVPVNIRVTADEDALYAEWRARTIVLCSVTGALTLAVGIILALGFSFFRRRLRVERLSREIEERDTLFREVNHRVKNNLTIVQTILELGTADIDDNPERAGSTMRSAIDRLRAIALLHELLCTHASDSNEDVGEYLQALTHTVHEAYSLGDRIGMEERHEEGLHCNLNRMLPLALIVNELLTNAYKYAFPGDRRGTIRVLSVSGAGGGIEIEICDDGIGMDESGKRTEGIGTMLIGALVRQIGATIERTGDDGRGTAWKLAVPPEPDGGEA
ncbi:MAG: hypothetical protein A2Z99_17320 [Treponema sp. GWB1_62_6]|nr:MAG: hypothetical protein A2Z99_17320 [Treponema sp. GWB1_62_6]